MKILLVAYQDLLVRQQDKWAIFLIFIAPLLIISLAAISFGEFHQLNVKKQKLAIINLDDRITTRQLQLVAMQLDQVVELVIIDQVKTKQSYQENKFPLVPVLTLPEKFSQKLLLSKNEKSTIILELKATGISKQLQALVAIFVKQLSLTLQQEFDGGYKLRFDKIAAENSNRKISAMSIAYFAPSMMIFFLMYSAFSGIRSLIKEKESGLLSRILNLPISVTSLLLGKIMAVFFVALLQIIILVLSSSLILGVSWGDSILGMVIMALVLAAAFTSFGTFIAVITKDINHASILGMGCILLLSCLGGNFIPVERFPEWMQHLSLISPNRWGLDGILDLTLRNQSTYEILLESSVLMVYAVVFFYLSLWRFKRQMTI